jgi:NAD(P)-dependent dehydrogenase (short-subunit alcohol dehydrogenase family)
MRLKDKVALITGAGSGIGKASALLFAQEGALVGVLGHKIQEIEATVEAIKAGGGQAIALLADVSYPAQMQQAVRQLVDRWDRIEIVFSNAGINGVWAPIDEIEPEEWDRTIDINLRGAFLTLKYTVPYLRRQGGSILITSSGQGTRSFSVPGSTAYACSKAALVTLAKKIALELARDQVRVNVICPGSTSTQINDTLTARNIEKIRLPIEFPQGKMLLTGGKKATPEQVAKLALFLASDDADVITGTEVWIDGGMSLMQG